MTSCTLDSFISGKFDVKFLKLKMNIKFGTFRKLLFGYGFNLFSSCMHAIKGNNQDISRWYWIVIKMINMWTWCSYPVNLCTYHNINILITLVWGRGYWSTVDKVLVKEIVQIYQTETSKFKTHIFHKFQVVFCLTVSFSIRTFKEFQILLKENYVTSQNNK